MDARSGLAPAAYRGGEAAAWGALCVATAPRCRCRPVLATHLLLDVLADVVAQETDKLLQRSRVVLDGRLVVPLLRAAVWELHLGGERAVGGVADALNQSAEARDERRGREELRNVMACDEGVLEGWRGRPAASWRVSQIRPPD